MFGGWGGGGSVETYVMGLEDGYRGLSFVMVVLGSFAMDLASFLLWDERVGRLTGSRGGGRGGGVKRKNTCAASAVVFSLCNSQSSI